MSLFILDTDTLSLLQSGHTNVLRWVLAARAAGDTLGITAITLEEQSKGWFRKVQTARDATQLARSSRRFCDAVESWAQFTLFPQTEASLARFDALVAAKLNVGKMDLRIAGVALENGAVDVTHNTRDFARVPGLTITDWTVPPAPPPAAATAP